MQKFRNFLLFLLWISGAHLCLGQAETEPKILHIYNWVDYLPQAVIDKFEKETGIKVHYDVFEGPEILEAKLLAASSGYDVVFPSAWPDLARLIPANVFMPLDFFKIPNAKSLSTVLMKKLARADPKNRYAVPYLWGTTGFAYNVAAIKKIWPDAPVHSLKMLFDPQVLEKLAPCRITLLDSPIEVFESALLYLKLDPSSERPEDLKKATDLLMTIRPFIHKFDSFQFIGQLVSGENCIAQTWSSYGNMAHKRGLEGKYPREIEYVIPKEGSFLWIDLMAIPKDAAHKENAHAFINFILQPEIIAEITNYTRTANAVSASQPLVRQEILENLGIYPSPQTWAKLRVDSHRSRQYQRLQLRAWTKIKTGR